MLTVLAQYHAYSGGDSAFLLRHFAKARAVAEWLLHRRSQSLEHPEDDPRHGIPPGDDEADNFNRLYFHKFPILHFYSSAAELYRACVELGSVWSTIGAASGHQEVAVHGASLSSVAPLLLRDFQASLNRTMALSGSDRCWPHVVESPAVRTHQMMTTFRGYSEIFYSGALSQQQTEDIYRMGLGLTNCSSSTTGIGRFLTVGSPASGTNIFTHIPFGFPFGLLAADMVECALMPATSHRHPQFCSARCVAAGRSCCTSSASRPIRTRAARGRRPRARTLTGTRRRSRTRARAST